MAQPQTVLAASNFLVPNATFIAELVAFVLILVIIGKYIVPPLQKVMRDRQELIERQVADSEAAAKRLAEAEADYQKAMTEARTQAAQIRENARAEAQSIVEQMRTSAQEESARIVARGEEQLANQRGAIVRELRAEVGTLAVELAEKIIDQRLSDDAQVSATVDSFIAGLDAQDRAGSAT
ncbi:MAG: F0F1 ATP synthase subunit B [Actinobacteria bacterium]|nr:F0F1 ATP synthase subunit B [Actinomycetota bacterium]